MNKIYEITPEGYNSITERQQLLNVKDVSPDMLSMLYNKRLDYTTDDNYAHIHVYGPLKTNTTKFERDSGMTDYKDIIQDLEMARVDPLIDMVILHFNSPGGESLGSCEVATYIERFPKPTIAIVESGICASAAYKIATACIMIGATESSQIGSIGSIVVITNTKEAMNSEGVYQNVFYNEGATIKSLAKDFGDLTEEQAAYIQQMVDQSGKNFQNVVLANRPEINPDTFNAAIYSGEEAMNMGLIDTLI